MKTGPAIRRVFRNILAWFNLLGFLLRKSLLGFDVANQFLSRLDKISVHLILKKNGAIIGKDCDLESGLRFHNCRSYRNLNIGNNCHIGKDCFFDLRDTVTIGNNVVISMQCTFITHIDMAKSPLSEKYITESAPIVIGSNTYIGARSTVLKGVIIGESAVVSACALVKNAVPSNTMVAGLPARMVKTI